ncbi:MAG TPA: hypothetical protein DC047_04015 [Blastocatellia bacterium]|nr:hypothetical protein [Blastocatellia bacterium]
MERQAIKKLIFPEIPEASLGYAQASNRGRGVTHGIATGLYTTAKAIIDAGINDPAIFEVAVLFEEKFGPDLISDMTVYMLLDELSAFNRRVAKGLGLPIRRQHTAGKIATCVFAKSQDQPILLIPNSILADLPLATDWSEIDDVCQYNESLRRRVNRLVQKAWGGGVKRISKFQIKSVFLANPHLLRELLTSYARAKAEPYDFDTDPRGIVIWHQASREYAKKNPLYLPAVKTTNEVYSVLKSICEHFKHLVEERGLSELLFDSDGRPKIEKASQLLFFGIADAYCVSNNIDISREPETGRGPADFKLSRGYQERVIVEVKLSSNGKYLDGLTNQLPTYLKAERANNGLLLLIKVGDHESRLKRIRDTHARLLKNGEPIPDLLIIDALKKPSASKLTNKHMF